MARRQSRLNCGGVDDEVSILEEDVPMEWVGLYGTRDCWGMNMMYRTYLGE
jgi:hypothetical protein